MAARIVSAVSRECSYSLKGSCLSRLGLLSLKLRHFSFISRFRTRNTYLLSAHCISSVHSASCVQAKVNLWEEYNRVKSLVEGNVQSWIWSITGSLVVVNYPVSNSSRTLALTVVKAPLSHAKVCR